MISPAVLQRGLQYFQQARTLQLSQHHADAASAYNQALALLPKHPEIIAGFAALAEDVQDWATAEKLYRRLGAVRPDSRFESKLAKALVKQDRPAEAIPLLQTCLIHSSHDAGLHNALAHCLASCGRWEESLACAERAWALRQDAVFLESILAALFQLGRAGELDQRVDDALARFPEDWKIRALYAQHHLKSFTRLGTAFQFVADMRRTNTGTVPVYDTDTVGRRWDGVPFDGMLRVVADAGLGDQLLGASMFAELERLGQRTQVLCDARLIPLLQRTFPALAFVSRESADASIDLTAIDPARDRRMNAIDLGQFFRQSPGDFPAGAGWLKADPERIARLRNDYRQRWPGKRLVGISWRSSRKLDGGADKSLALPALAALLRQPDCVFISLQYGDVAAEIASLRAEAGIDIHVDATIDATADIEGLAAQVAALDLVISTSNTTVHVAGALGIPTWVILPRVRPVLWYWGYAGERTPWYPSLRLWRNLRDSGWQELLASMASELAASRIAAG